MDMQLYEVIMAKKLLKFLKNDTMQRNGSKASHSSNSKGQRSDSNESNAATHATTATAAATTMSSNNHKAQQQHQQSNRQRKSKAGNNHNHNHNNNNNSKRHESVVAAAGAAASAANHHHQQQQQQQQQQQTAAGQTTKRSSGFSVDEWLGRGVLFCYDRASRSSSAGDNGSPRHNPGHRNSTSSETGASDDLSSGTGDVCLVKVNSNKKSKKLRQKRQQQSQQQNQQQRLNNEKQQRNKNHQQQQNINSNNNNNNGKNKGGGGGGAHKGNGNQGDEDFKETRRNKNHPQQNQHHHHQQQQKAHGNAKKQNGKGNAHGHGHGHGHNRNSNGVTNSGVGGNASDAWQQQQQGSHYHYQHQKQQHRQHKGQDVQIQNTSYSIQMLKNKTIVNNKMMSSTTTTLSASISTMSLISSSDSSSSNSTPMSSPKNSPTASPVAYKRANHYVKRQYHHKSMPYNVLDSVTLDEEEFIRLLRRFVIDPNLLRIYGYPVESTVHEGCVEIFKCLPKHIMQAKATQHLANNPNNRHNNVINRNDGLYMNGRHVGDSGCGSSDSSPASVDSDSSETGEDETNGITAFYTPDGVYQIFSQYDNSLEKQCVRCKNAFMVTSEGEYLTQEACFYHLGKLNPLYEGESIAGWQYNCCQGNEYDLGCCSNSVHVWTGAAVGLNGPYNDFVRTKSRPEHRRSELPKVYALDCEMSFTGRGLEVTKVTLVAYNGGLVYETFVKPDCEIVDYNTRFSGITEEDLTNEKHSVKSLHEVQQDLLQLIDADTFLIGHGLDNDLRVLRILHKTVIDTSISFPHANGFPFRRALRHLMKVYLNRDIQTGDKGHSSYEDSRACLELLVWKLRRELQIDFYD